MTDRHPLLSAPNWAPAFAGVLLGYGWRDAECATSPASCSPMRERQA